MLLGIVFFPIQIVSVNKVVFGCNLVLDGGYRTSFRTNVNPGICDFQRP